MIDDLIEFAHLHRLVINAVPEPDGCDAYLLRASPRSIGVWVRRDGRFDHAADDGEFLTLGQVVDRVAQAAHDHDPPVRHTTQRSRALLDS